MNISEADRHLFRDHVARTVPLDKDGKTCKNPAQKHPIFTAYSYIYDATLSATDVINYACAGVSLKILKHLKHGNFSCVTRLDLHGETSEQACQLMADFIHRHQAQTCLKIIHGKGNHTDGMSILKTQVARFLEQHPQVLAAQSCAQKDGGTGAVFVLLKQ